MDQFERSLGGLTWFVLQNTIGIVINALVAGQLWAWFLLPVFGWAVPPLAALAGFGLLAKWFVQTSRDWQITGAEKKPDSAVRAFNLIVWWGIRPLFVLTAGFLLHFFV